MILARCLLLGAACWAVMMLPGTSPPAWAVEGTQQQEAGQEFVFKGDTAGSSHLKAQRTV